LTLLHDAAMKWYFPFCLDALAGVASAAGQPAQAARLFGAAECLRESESIPLVSFLSAAYERDVVAAQAQMDAPAFAAAWAAGRAMPLEQAIAEALQIAG
jgi:hypothetical protein